MKKFEQLGRKLSKVEQKSIYGGDIPPEGCISACQQQGDVCGLQPGCPDLVCCSMEGTCQGGKCVKN